MSSSKLINRAVSIASHLPFSVIKSVPRASMATASTISVSQSTPGVLHLKTISEDASSAASTYLQRDWETHHMYFNTEGFHNHIAHHLLTIFSLGANPTQIKSAFENNASYQRTHFPVSEENVSAMADPANWPKFLRKEKHFADWEVFFLREIEAHNGSWQNVVNKYLFADTPEAKDMLIRMYAGFYHPIIHLGFGIEFEQPAIIVEALAQAATHDNWPGNFVNRCMERAQQRTASGEQTAPLLDLIYEAAKNETTRGSAHLDDGNKLRDGVFKRAMPEITSLCSKWHLPTEPSRDELRFRTAEMINTCAYYTISAQHPSRKKRILHDFFLMHATNCSLFFSAFIDPKNDHWLSNANRAKLLQIKAWSDVAMYVSRGCPRLLPEEIQEYTPKRPDTSWEEIFKRVSSLTQDDGHASKLIRALANGEQACKEYEGDERTKNWGMKAERGDWLQAAHMVIDSVEESYEKGAGFVWLRNVGFEEVWKDVPDRK